MLLMMRDLMNRNGSPEKERKLLKRRSDIIQNMLMRGVMPREVANITGVPLDYVRHVSFDICNNHF